LAGILTAGYPIIELFRNEGLKIGGSLKNFESEADGGYDKKMSGRG